MREREGERDRIIVPKRKNPFYLKFPSITLFLSPTLFFLENVEIIKRKERTIHNLKGH